MKTIHTLLSGCVDFQHFLNNFRAPDNFHDRLRAVPQDGQASEEIERSEQK